MSEVERDRLAQLVNVLNAQLKDSHDAMVSTEAALRGERKQTAKLERLLEKAQIELRSNTSEEG